MKLLEIASTGRFGDLVVPTDVQPTIRQASLLLVAATASAPRGWTQSGSLRIWRRAAGRRGTEHIDQLATTRAGEPEGRLAWTAQILGVMHRLSAAAELTAADPEIADQLRDLQIRVGLLLAMVDDVRTPEAADDLVWTLARDVDDTLALWNGVGVLPSDLIGRAVAVSRLNGEGIGPNEDWQRLARLAADVREEGNEIASTGRDEQRYGGLLGAVWRALPFYEAATHLIALAAHRRRVLGEDDPSLQLATEALATDETRANAVEALTSLGRYFVSRPCHLLGGLEDFPLDAAIRTVLLSTRAGLPAYPRSLEPAWDAAVADIGPSVRIPSGSAWTQISYRLEEELEQRFATSFADSDLARAGLLLEPELRTNRLHDLADRWESRILTGGSELVHRPGASSADAALDLRTHQDLLDEILGPDDLSQSRRRR